MPSPKGESGLDEVRHYVKKMQNERITDVQKHDWLIQIFGRVETLHTASGAICLDDAEKALLGKGNFPPKLSCIARVKAVSNLELSCGLGMSPEQIHSAKQWQSLQHSLRIFRCSCHSLDCLVLAGTSAAVAMVKAMFLHSRVLVPVSRKP